ncbi:MAG: hypothetical protein AB7K37_15955 [Cyclobacteriaceae bacterium]
MSDKPPLRFDICWKKVNPVVRGELLKFWTESGLLAAEHASKRAEEVVMVVRNDAGEIVGVSTAYKSAVKQLGNPFYFFRCAIHPRERHPGLTSTLLVKTRDYLESIHLQDGEPVCKGLMTVVENPRINEGRREAVWPASKMIYIGSTKEGNQVRLYYFKGATI